MRNHDGGMDTQGDGPGDVATVRRALEDALASLDIIEVGAASSSEHIAHLESRVAELEGSVAELDADRGMLTTKLVDTEQQAGRLLNLYVAAYQLHATLDPLAVQETIAEITLNLLGAERFALLLQCDTAPERHDIVLAEGLPPEGTSPLSGTQYLGGDPMIDAALADGSVRIGPMDGSCALCVVPLTVQGSTMGALVVLKLLDHEHTPLESSRDLLDLMAAHAASALIAARAYSSADRKLKTLEGLMNLVRRER